MGLWLLTIFYSFSAGIDFRLRFLRLKAVLVLQGLILAIQSVIKYNIIHSIFSVVLVYLHLSSDIKSVLRWLVDCGLVYIKVPGSNPRCLSSWLPLENSSLNFGLFSVMTLSQCVG